MGPLVVVWYTLVVVVVVVVVVCVLQQRLQHLHNGGLPRLVELVGP